MRKITIYSLSRRSHRYYSSSGLDKNNVDTNDVLIQPQVQDPITWSNALPVGKLEWSICTTKNPLAASVALCLTICLFSSRAVAGF